MAKKLKPKNTLLARIKTLNPKVWIGVGVALVLWIFYKEVRSLINQRVRTYNYEQPRYFTKEELEGWMDEEILYAIDISKHNTILHWDSLHTGNKDLPIDIIIMKATEGVTYRDPKLPEYIMNNYTRGIPMGYYHFFRQKSDPVAQAKFYMKTVKKPLEGNLIPILDVEQYPGKPELEVSADVLVDRVKQFVSTIEEEWKMPVLIYTNSSFYDRFFKDKIEASFWIAHYGIEGKPEWFKDKKVVGWQFTDNTGANGLGGRVDGNIFLENRIDDIIVE